MYTTADDRLELAAHAGFAIPPPLILDPTAERDDDAADAVIRLATRRGPVGALLLDRATAEAIPPPFATSLGATAATALAGARLLGRARRDLRRARALGAVSKELAGELDLSRVLDDIIERTRTLFGADRAGLWQFDDTRHPVALVTRGLSPSFLARSAALTTDSRTIGVRAMRDGRPRWARNAHANREVGEMRDAYGEEGIRTVCIVPLRSGGMSIGVLGLYHDTDYRWPDGELALVQAFADQAAIAIQNARLYRSVAEQAARMQSIQDLSARLNRLTDVRAIGEAIVAEAITLADYHDIRIYRVDWELRRCDPIAFTREMLDADAEDAVELLRVELGEGFTGWVAEHGEPLLINNALDDERGKTIEGTDDVPESMLVVPMLYEGRALGVIVLSQLGFDRFSNDDLQTMSIFAGYAAQAMANATTYEQLLAKSTELARRADSQRRLLQINERLLSTLDQADVLETIADGLRDVVAYDNLSVYRADHPTRTMVPVLTRERHAEQVSRYLIPFGRGLMGWAVQHAQPILANDALSDPRALQIPGTPEDPEAVAVVPLVADGEVLGALNVSRVGGPEVYFSDSDFELIQLFSAQASIALRNADAHHAVSQRAETDALTGLANHGAFQRDLGTLIDSAAAASRHAERRIALLMMDLDRFKSYNDRHGHPAGDALLHRIAVAIYGAARSEDRVYRYGGDEFALILPAATVAEGARVAERVRRAVARLTAADPSPVTISIGVAGVPTDAMDRATLISAADTALYFGKRSDEDTVVRADRLPAEVADLRGTLEELAAALREGDDSSTVEHLVERASQLGVAAHERQDSLRDALLAISRSFDARDAAQRGHADRVGRLASAIATRARHVGAGAARSRAGRTPPCTRRGRAPRAGPGPVTPRGGPAHHRISATRRRSDSATATRADPARTRRLARRRSGQRLRRAGRRGRRTRAGPHRCAAGPATGPGDLARRRAGCPGSRRARPPRRGPTAARGRRRPGGSRRRLRYHPGADDDLPPRFAAPGRGREPGARGRPRPRGLLDRRARPDRSADADDRDARSVDDPGSDARANADPGTDPAVHERARHRPRRADPDRGERRARGGGAVRRVRADAGRHRDRVRRHR